MDSLTICVFEVSACITSNTSSRPAAGGVRCGGVRCGGVWRGEVWRGVEGCGGVWRG